MLDAFAPAFTAMYSSPGGCFQSVLLKMLFNPGRILLKPLL